MSVTYTCRYVIKGKPAELAAFVGHHIHHGRFDLNSLGIDYPEYFDDENPYDPRQIMKYGITELNIWLTVVKRNATKRQFVEEDIYEAIKEKYPNLEVHYGYNDNDSMGLFHFPWGSVRAGYENLKKFNVDYELEPIKYFNKLVLEGDSDDLNEFLENELEEGKLKSHMWSGNVNMRIENRVAIYFEELDGYTQMETYENILSKYPQLHVKMYSMSIRYMVFQIYEKGKETIRIKMYTYDDFLKLINEYDFLKRSYSSGEWVDFAFINLVIKACERYRYENEIYREISLMMYGAKAASNMHLYHC